MTTTEALPVYTVPSTWVRLGDFRRTRQPYKRIVGVLTEGEITWANPLLTADPEGTYAKNKAEETVLSVTPKFGERLTEYFATYIAGCRDLAALVQNYNCHHFGRSMRGESADNRSLRQPPREVVEGTPLTQSRLEVGQMGVIGFKYRGHQRASHSVVGLGHEVDECIQVMALNGHLGLQSYDEALTHYRGESPDWRDYGIYV